MLLFLRFCLVDISTFFSKVKLGIFFVSYSLDLHQWLVHILVMYAPVKFI